MVCNVQKIALLNSKILASMKQQSIGGDPSLRLSSQTQSFSIVSAGKKVSSGSSSSSIEVPILEIPTPADQLICRERFGKYGGKYVPETIISGLSKLEAEFYSVLHDSLFQVDFLDNS